MHYIIFGKFQSQNKPLNTKTKAFLWDKTNLVALFAQRYLQHKAKSNLYTQDVYFLGKATVYKLESNQFETDNSGDVIMLDSSIFQNFRYPETEISNINLNAYCDKLQDPNIVIHLINLN
jgi:hypothetical protein